MIILRHKIIYLSRLTQILLFFAIFVIGCTTTQKAVVETSKNIQPSFASNKKINFLMDLGEVTLPFSMEVKKNNAGQFYGIISNAEEKIETAPFEIIGDSIFIKSTFFNSVFKGKFSLDAYGKFITKIEGNWRNYMKPGVYEIPFTGDVVDNTPVDYSLKNLSSNATYHPSTFNGKWEVTFSPNTEDEYKSIGIFKVNDLRITGTFLTETGDYRFLEGIGNTSDPATLSCFDGSHAFYFNFLPNKNGDTLRGMFYSGKHWSEPWVAVRNENFELQNPDSLTFIVEGYEGVNFTFPNLEKEEVSFPSDRFKDKVTIIQIMGSWCPNCVDETKVLSDFYNSYKEKGLEVVALCFETTSDFEKSKKSVSAHKDHFGAKYEFLIAGTASTKSASAALPMLNKVMSFPTTIFIDKKGVVRKIYTGFYGPSTGKYHLQYIEQTTSFIQKLLIE